LSGHFKLLHDAQGDIIALVNSSGKVERTFRYGPYGENVKSEGTQTIPYPFGYKGGYRMPGGNKGERNVVKGLYHYGQRYYDPTTGRWTQQDPLRQPLSSTEANLFEGFGGDLINLNDPTGKPGELAGAQCEFNTTYHSEHPGLYAEIEANPWEPVDAYCASCFWVPGVGYACGAAVATQFYSSEN
jgi:RHS repeat-associated protein